MTQVKSGDTVRIHYTGTLADGTTFDSSKGRDPLEFTVGSGQIIPGLDVAIPGMTVGEQKKVVIAATDAYGEYHEGASQVIPKGTIPKDIPTEVGTQLQMQNPEGQAMMVVITASDDESITVDANHPLAGKELTFDFTLEEIV